MNRRVGGPEYVNCATRCQLRRRYFHHEFLSNSKKHKSLVNGIVIANSFYGIEIFGGIVKCLKKMKDNLSRSFTFWFVYD